MHLLLKKQHKSSKNKASVHLLFFFTPILFFLSFVLRKSKSRICIKPAPQKTKAGNHNGPGIFWEEGSWHKPLPDLFPPPVVFLLYFFSVYPSFFSSPVSSSSSSNLFSSSVFIFALLSSLLFYFYITTPFLFNPSSFSLSLILPPVIALFLFLLLNCHY